MRTGTEQKLYWPQLDGLRALAFLLVFFSHLEAIPIPPDAGPFMFHLLHTLNLMMSWGWMGVQLFFLLSGFLITLLLLEERQQTGMVSLRDFLARRTLRIWPLYYLLLLVNFVLMPAIFIKGPFGLETEGWWNAVQTYLFPFSVFMGNFVLIAHQKVNVALSLVIMWSICVEEHFYLLWGMIFSKIQKIQIIVWVVLALIPVTFFSRLYCFNATHWFGTYYFNTFTQMDPFLAGAILAFCQHRRKFETPFFSKAGPWLFGAGILYYGLLSIFAPNLDKNQFSMVIIYGLNSVFGAGLFIALLVWQPAIRLFSQNWLVKTGRLTYGMYLFHIFGILLAQACLRPWIGPVKDPTSWLIFCLVALSMTILLASLSWQVLEKRCLAIRKHFVKIPSGSY